MHHRYETRALVLARTPLGEANALITLITSGLGLVRARAQGVRRSGAKLAPALTTFAESSVLLVRGKEGWRIAGAVLEERWLLRLERLQARAIATRIAGLLVRLVADEVREPDIFPLVQGFFTALATLPEKDYEAAEILAALRLLAVLGFDAGEIPGAIADFSPGPLAAVSEERAGSIARVNRGIAVSGL
ncbi:recombination protein O N-terminal domain-containing protein [Patescibacteria group bacterium]|nr:recombination protein O N-terminal domain-containing protein [Patescibacteria group bacterium]